MGLSSKVMDCPALAWLRSDSSSSSSSCSVLRWRESPSVPPGAFFFLPALAFCGESFFFPKWERSSVCCSSASNLLLLLLLFIIVDSCLLTILRPSPKLGKGEFGFRPVLHVQVERYKKKSKDQKPKSQIPGLAPVDYESGTWFFWSSDMYIYSVECSPN